MGNKRFSIHAPLLVHNLAVGNVEWRSLDEIAESYRLFGWRDSLVKVIGKSVEIADESLLGPDDPKACPFCSNPDIHFEYPYLCTNRDRRVVRVSCDECGARGPLGDSDAGAIEKWNEVSR